MTPDAIGGMRLIQQWFLWLLTWKPEEGKFAKVPCNMDGTTLQRDTPTASLWTTYDAAAAALAKLPVTDSVRYAMGFWLSEGCGYWLLDIDKCVHDGQVLPFAMQLVDAYPGAMVEWSSSGKGLHVIGRSASELPPHRNKPERSVSASLKPLDLEFYSRDRGIAFGLDGQAQGNADTVCDMGPLCAAYFPPRPVGAGAGRMPQWNGPTDDDELIRRMLQRRASAGQAFGGGLTVQQLWAGECEHNSDADMALIAHLGWWTGWDEERMARLMARSGLVRDKWSDRRPGGNYITYSIERAAQGADSCYVEPAKNTSALDNAYGLVPASTADITTLVAPASADRVSPELFARVEELIAQVEATEREIDIHNIVMPAITAAGIPPALHDRLANAVKRKLHFYGNTMGVAKVRALLFPPSVRSELVADPDGVPEWVKPWCFVGNGDKFYNVNDNQFMTLIGFQAIHGRLMPLNDQGRRDNAAERALHFWQIPTVSQIGYRPDQPSFFTWDGVSYANSYSPASVPLPLPYTQAGIDGIEAFQSLLWDMCGRRADVFGWMLSWYAHNVQHPGRKIRWAPIMKGVQGDGKTLCVTVLRAAMGHRNVNTTSNSNISNSGGFTDWAVRGAVNIIEEIHLTGKARHMLYNASKEFISNDVVDVNPKGGKPYQSFNTTNHYANTNHSDAVPMEPSDRRWLVVFTPWSSLEAMRKYCGLDEEGAKARTRRIDHAWRHCAGELRTWFLSLPMCEGFDIDGDALMTPEKTRMMASSRDDAETTAAAIVDNALVISSSMLSNRLSLMAARGGFDIPRGHALNAMITRMGYSKLDKQVKWDGQTHTVWVKDGVEMTNDEIRVALDALKPQLKPT